MKKNQNLHYARGIASKRVTSDEAQFRDLEPGQHGSEEMPQRWRAVGNTVSDSTGRELNPRPPAPIVMYLTTELTGW